MVRILTGADAGVKSPLVMPGDAELRALAKIVYTAHPRLDPTKDHGFNQTQHDSAFRKTFWATGWFGRMPQPVVKEPRHITWWAATATDFLREHRLDLDVDSRMFCATILAHGDVPHSITSRFPLDVHLGLTLPHGGTSARDAWRAVLKTGNPRPATKIEIPRYELGSSGAKYLAPGDVGFGSTR